MIYMTSGSNVPYLEESVVQGIFERVQGVHDRFDDLVPSNHPGGIADF
jgi:hypothetical protein